MAVIGAVLYVDGHGIHLAANSIGHEELTGEAKDVTHFWDEEWGHFEWHLGLFVLIGRSALGERQGCPWLCRAVRGPAGLDVLHEHGRRGHVVARAGRDCGLRALGDRGTASDPGSRPWRAFGLTALMIGIWALWHQGMPQFSDVGFS